jgi:hypothetical protein
MNRLPVRFWGTDHTGKKYKQQADENEFYIQYCYLGSWCTFLGIIAYQFCEGMFQLNSSNLLYA